MTDRVQTAPRLFKTAVAGSTLPLVVLGSAALAAPAAASTPSLAPRAATASTILAAQSALPQVAVLTPRTSLPTARAAATYTVQRGDTLSHISIRTDVSLSTLLKANGLSRTSIIRPGQVLKLAVAEEKTASSASDSGAPASAGKSSAATYTVRAGDTLSHIAVRHQTTVRTLQAANDLGRSSMIRPGQVLKLTVDTSAPSKGTSSGTQAPSAPAATYTVRRGDTLSGIAARSKVSLATLLSANGLSRSTLIHPGQVLKLSAQSGATIRPAATKPEKQLVPSTFLHYRYPAHVVASANENKRALLNSPIPSRAETITLIRDTARKMGVDPRLALGHAMAESTLNHASVSPANAIGTMQVIPSSGKWASQMVGRELNLLDPQDNVTAGVAIIRHLQRTSPNMDIGIASYYQGAAGVRRNGMYPDTRQYVAKVKGYMKQF